MANPDQDIEPQEPMSVEMEDDISGFAQHYSASSASVREVLSEIVEDMTSYRSIHNWDDRLIISPIKLLRAACTKYMQTNQNRFDFLLAYSIVEEVFTHQGVKHVFPAMAHPGDVDRHLFFLNEPLKEGRSSSSSRGKEREAGTSSKPDIPAEHALNALRGRVIYIYERIPHFHRAVLLLLYTFCIRLHNEDHGYIQSFINRHLNIRNLIRMPQHWQETAGPELSSKHQRAYKRVSISCHITYLTVNISDSNEEAKDLVDRSKIFSTHHSKVAANPTNLRLFRASASTLLTIAIPEECDNHEEEVNLLQSPEGFWTVLAVNSPSRFAADEEPPEHLTPIAQYVRGITSSLVIQRQNAESILDTLRERIKACDGDSLFDDEKFTKSNLYHWTVRTCDEMRNTIAGTLRFMQRVKKTQMDWLRREAHMSEKLGLDYWASQLEDEVFKLEDLQDQISALNAQVQESRNALHGVTAVLEARVALQQGKRIKVLAYLATLYLPLTATASIYSMSVLPTSTPLYSFFIVLVLLVLLTFSTGYFLSPLLTTIKLPLHRSATHVKHAISHILPLLGLPFLVLKHFEPGPLFDSKHSIYNPFWLVWYIFHELPAKILHQFLIPEIMFPRDQWIMSKYIGNRYVDIRWHPLAFVRDAFRLVLLPAWVALAVAIVAYMIALYLVIGAVFCPFAIWEVAVGSYKAVKSCFGWIQRG